MPSPDIHADAARNRLCHLAGLRSRTEASGQAIQAAAAAELERIQGDQKRLAPRVDLDPAAAETYQRNTLDAGRLHTILGHGA